MANMGVLTVKLQADTKGLAAISDAMLRVQRDILTSVQRMETAITNMGNTSVSVSKKMASANKTAQESIRTEINKTAQTQASISGTGVAGQGLKTAEQEAQRVATRLSGMFQPFNKEMTASIATISQRFRTFGYLASATLTAPIVLAGKAAFNMAKDFEFAMNKIVGLTGTARSVVNGWEKELLDIGREFGKRPQELAEGLYFIASSGIKGAEAMNVLKMSAKAAASGLGETTDIANFLTSALNAYRGTGLTAAYATDVLVAGVREGKAEAAGFAAAMGSVLPIASKLGVSIDQVAGSMAAVTLTGSTAAQAATYLRQMLNGLMKGSKGGADALEMASGQIEGMSASYEDLRNVLKSGGIMALMEKLKKLQEEYGESIVSKVFPNIRAMQEVFALTGNNMKYSSDLMKRVTNSTGSLGKAFAAVADTIKVRYDRALSAANASLIELGKSVATAFLPILEKWIKKLDSLTKWFSELSDSWKNLIFWAIKWVALAGPITLGVSVLGYAVVGLRTAMNGLGGAIKSILILFNAFNISTVNAGARFGMLRKIVTAKSLFGNLSTFLKNPYTIIAASAVAATVAFVAYRKRIKEIAQEHTIFAQSVAQVNGEMKKLKDLSKEDYSSMTAQDLATNITATTKALTDARKKLIDAYQNAGLSQEKYAKLRASLEQKVKTGKAISGYENPLKELEKYSNSYIVTLEDSVIGLQRSLKSMQDALKIKADESAAAYVASQTEEAADNAKKLEEQLAKVSDIWNELSAGRVAIQKEEFLKKDSFDEIQATYNLLDSVLQKIAQTPEIDVNSQKVKDVIEEYVRLGELVNKTTNATKEFNAELAAIDMKKFLLGDQFDANAAKIDAYQKRIDALVEDISKNPALMTALPFNATTFAIQTYINEIEKLKQANDNLVDQRNIKLLEDEANIFGTMTSRLSVLDAMVQSTERSLREMIKTGKLNGQVVSDADIKDAVKNLEILKKAQLDLQNAIDTKYVSDLNNALGTTSTMSDVLSNKISVLETNLQYLSKKGQGASKEFINMAKELKNLEIAQTAFDTLSNAFEDMFDSMIQGGKNMEEVFKNIVSSILRQITAAIAKMIAMKIIMAVFSKGGSALSNINIGAAVANIPTFATGGVVPPGYPNDTYLARLTSGEQVIPAGKLNKSLQPIGTSIMEGEVVFEIGQDKLVGILKKANKKNSLY